MVGPSSLDMLEGFVQSKPEPKVKRKLGFSKEFVHPLSKATFPLSAPKGLQGPTLGSNPKPLDV